jgi:hypothetical protein
MCDNVIAPDDAICPDEEFLDDVVKRVHGMLLKEQLWNSMFSKESTIAVLLCLDVRAAQSCILIPKMAA